jgi:hypothetical protein
VQDPAAQAQREQPPEYSSNHNNASNISNPLGWDTFNCEDRFNLNCFTADVSPPATFLSDPIVPSYNYSFAPDVLPITAAQLPFDQYLDFGLQYPMLPDLGHGRSHLTPNNLTFDDNSTLDYQPVTNLPIPDVCNTSACSSVVYAGSTGSQDQFHSSPNLSLSPQSNGNTHKQPDTLTPQGSNDSTSSPTLSKSGKPAQFSGVKKRELNTLAARRYRQRRTDQVTGLETALKETEAERDALKNRVARLEGELDALRSLLAPKS